jgi:hypothetical protein
MVPEIQKPASDVKQYRNVLLKNNLHALIVHDPRIGAGTHLGHIPASDHVLLCRFRPDHLMLGLDNSGRALCNLIEVFHEHYWVRVSEAGNGAHAKPAPSFSSVSNMQAVMAQTMTTAQALRTSICHFRALNREWSRK